MEKLIRKPFQGVLNIIQFNLHFYLIAFASIALLFFLIAICGLTAFWVKALIIMLILGIISSLTVSFYIYDLSDFYSFGWLKFNVSEGQAIVNINAGFDETSAIISTKFSTAKLRVLDFYDPTKHTEFSIKRARQMYPAFPGTEKIETDHLPLLRESIDFVFLIFAAHEIRDNQERISFFRNLNEALKIGGKIIVVEHSRDIANFLAYNFGFFHFLPFNTWRRNFIEADLKEESISSFTPFLKIFILGKHGVSS